MFMFHPDSPLKTSFVPNPVSYKYIVFFLLFASLSSFGQNYPEESEDAFWPDSLYAVRNAVKIDPLQVIFGDFSIYYERIFKSRYSAEFGVGFTRRNYAAGWFDYSLDNLGENVDIETGYALSVSARRYFKDSGELNGLYLALGFSVRSYKTDYYVIDTTGTLTDISFEDNRLFTSGSVIVGYQALSIRSNIFVDAYLGLALVNKDFDIVTSSDINDPSAYYIVEKKEYALGMEVGVKIGFGF